MTKESIIKDLVAMYKKYGIDFILFLCAALLYEHQWYNWDEIKKELNEQL